MSAELLVRAESVHKSFGSNQVLRGINLEVLWVGGEVIGYRQDGNRLTELSDTQVARQRRSIGMVFKGSTCSRT
jgi:polar amino acid transport system ATP-binding protein